MDKLIKISGESYQWLHLQGLAGESFDATLRRMAGLPSRRRVAVEKKITRPRYPVLGMLSGDEITVPWVVDPLTGQTVQGSMRGLNACVARCNRLAGRRYRSTATPAGLHIVRLS